MQRIPAKTPAAGSRFAVIYYLAYLQSSTPSIVKPGLLGVALFSPFACQQYGDSVQYSLDSHNTRQELPRNAEHKIQEVCSGRRRRCFRAVSSQQRNPPDRRGKGEHLPLRAQSHWLCPHCSCGSLAVVHATSPSVRYQPLACASRSAVASTKQGRRPAPAPGYIAYRVSSTRWTATLRAISTRAPPTAPASTWS